MLPFAQRLADLHRPVTVRVHRRRIVLIRYPQNHRRTRLDRTVEIRRRDIRQVVAIALSRVARRR